LSIAILGPADQVIALDPRGMGDSDRPASGHDLRTVTSDVHGFVGALGLTSKGPVDVVGHDVGTWIGYAYAAEWPSCCRTRTRVLVLVVETMRLVAIDVRGGVFEGCGHYIPEEAPRALADQIIKFMGV
jgi:pimeloyl-ACP methyl ester carboxylesterase